MFKNVNWGTVIAAVLAVILLFALWQMFTAKHIDANGKIITKFEGFGGSDENFEGEA